MTEDEIRLIDKYCEKNTENVSNASILLCTLSKHHIKYTLEMDEKNGNLFYSVSIKDVSESDIDTESLYDIFKNGFYVNGDFLILNVSS